MSFKKWSAAQDAAAKNPAVAADDKAAVAPELAPQPEKTPEEIPVEGPPAKDA